MARRIWAVVIPVVLVVVVGLTLWAQYQAQAQAHPSQLQVAAGRSSVDTPGGGIVQAVPVNQSPLAPAGTPLTTTRIVNVPILMYHHVGNPNTWQTYNVDTAMFEWQMDYLDRQGYHTVSLDDITAALNGALTLPEKPIAITFDDGWVLQITNTLPVLLRHHFQATYYIITNVTGRRVANMTWDQVRQLRDAGMWIGSHTLSHGYLPGMSAKRLRDELFQSKAILEQQLSMTITSLAYPGGAFNARVERVAQAAGYTSAVTVRKGYDQRSDGLYRLLRVGVYGVDTEERFIAKVDETFFTKTWPYPTGQAKLPVDANPER